jgi:hypothetical protein
VNIFAARTAMSMWPKVMGSNVPGYNAVGIEKVPPWFKK